MGVTELNTPYNNRKSISAKSKDQMFREAIKPILVGNLSDIREVINNLLKTKIPNNSVQLSTEMVWTEDEDGKTKSVKGVVTGSNNDVSLYGLLLSGMDIVKVRVEAADKLRAQIELAKSQDPDISIDMTVWDVDKSKFNVDSLIERRLGGKRYGLRVRWVVPEGTFDFDPYEAKLYAHTDNEPVTS